MPEVLFFFREERAVKTETRKIKGFFFFLEVARYLIDHAKGKKNPLAPRVCLVLRGQRIARGSGTKTYDADAEDAEQLKIFER